MQITITDEQRRMLVDLVEGRIRELHPTIRRSRVSSCTDSLKQDLEDFETLLRTLSEPKRESVG
jgi:hypothetical protein